MRSKKYEIGVGNCVTATHLVSVNSNKGLLMPPRIAERELVDPALECLYNSEAGEISTTELRDHLTRVFEPEGEDTAILDGRVDTKFDQKVRNLKSHKTLEKTGQVEATRKGFRLSTFGERMRRERSRRS